LKNVRVLPRVSDVTELYRAHHVILRNSTYEGANYTLIEGAAEGCIPLGSPESGGAIGYLEEGRSGFVISGADDDRYARALRDLLEDPGKVRDMRAAALDFARERCGPSVLVNFLEEQMPARL
jgi:glycosyltransferase involved in cell wall biosynthesis